MGNILNVSVISPENILFEGEVDSITLPGSESAFTVLPNHVNLIGELDPGMVMITVGDENQSYIIDGGFVEVSDNKVSALVEGAKNAEDIDPIAEAAELDELIGQIIEPAHRMNWENSVKVKRARIRYSAKKE